MTKTALKHISFWIVYFGLEIIMFRDSWSPRFWAIALVNNSLTLFSFYSCYYLGFRFYDDLQNSSIIKKFNSYSGFGKFIAILVLFISLRSLTDLFVFNPNSNVSIGKYVFSLFRIVLSSTVTGLLLGINEKRKQIITISEKRREAAEARQKEAEAKQMAAEAKTKALEIKAAQLDNTITVKEQVITELDRQVNLLILSREELIIENEQITAASTQLKEENLQVKDENELLQLSKTGLEEDISQHQNHILIYKAQLLAGQEDYRQLALKYDRKFDFYHKQLNTYRNLYGRLDIDDEDEPE